MRKLLIATGMLVLTMSSAAVAQDDEATHKRICSDPRYQSFESVCPNYQKWGPTGVPPTPGAAEANAAAKASIEAIKSQAPAQRPENKMGMTRFVMMSLAYDAYCVPLSDDVRAKVRSVYQSLSADEKWRAEHSDPFNFSRMLYEGSKADLENREPWTRQQFALGHNQRCAAIGEGIKSQAAAVK
jgi:hypothetical protein